MGKDTEDNEHADHQSEAPSMENVITKHSNLEEKFPAESCTKSNYDEEPLEKILELYSVDNSEIKTDGKVMPEKAIDSNKATEVELQISKAKSNMFWKFTPFSIILHPRNKLIVEQNIKIDNTVSIISLNIYFG